MLTSHKNASRIKNVFKNKKSLLPAKEVVFIIFFQNESCFRGNKPCSCAWPFPLSSSTAVNPTLPCPSHVLLILEGAGAELWLLASCACPPHGWAMPSPCPASPSSLRSLSSLLANRMNFAGNVCLWDLSFSFRRNRPVFLKGRWKLSHSMVMQFFHPSC